MKDIECSYCDMPITIIALADGLHVTWTEHYADSLIPWSELGVTAVTFAHPKQHGVESAIPPHTIHTCCVCKQSIEGIVYHCNECRLACCEQHVSMTTVSCLKTVHQIWSCDNCMDSDPHTPPPLAIPDDAFIPSNDAERLFGVPAGYSTAERDWQAPQTTPDIDCQDDYEFATGTGRYAEPDEPECLATSRHESGDDISPEELEAWL